MSKTLVLDVEANGLENPTEMWCMVTHCIETGERREFVWDKERSHLGPARKYIEDADSFIMHNGVSYDRHVINGIVGVWIPVKKVQDTMLRSRLFNPTRS
jgi:hypothetical protein